MLRTDYLSPHNNPAVVAFVNWLAIQISNGAPPLGFPLNFGAQLPAFPTIMDAFSAYAWPPRRTTIQFPVPPTPVVLDAHSSFPANSAVLARCEEGLRLAIGNAPMLTGWISTVWQWGGVAKPASLSWLGNHQSICGEVAGVSNAIFGLPDDDPGPLGLPAGFRFNSGMTKVYSLISNELIIFDSRVAIALAWLVASQAGPNPDELLRFRQPPRQGNTNPLGQFAEVFRPTNGRPSTYLTWNIRATWIIAEAIRLAGSNCAFPGNTRDKLRTIEAGLFMLGQ